MSTRGVAVVGVGVSEFGAFPEKSNRDLFLEAVDDLHTSVDRGLRLHEVEALYVGNMIGGIAEGQSHLGAILIDALGLAPRAAMRVEGACASSSMALRTGIMAIASGWYDVVLVGGTEKMTTLPTETATEALASAMDAEYEIAAGFTFPGIYGAMAAVYMNRYGVGRDDLMHVTIKNHENGSLNPKAHFSCSIRDVMARRAGKAEASGQAVPQWESEFGFLRDPSANPVIAWPLHLFDCSPISDGASCLLLAAEDVAGRYSKRPVFVIGSGQASDYPLYERQEATSLAATKVAAREAYGMAGVTPEQIQLAEVHDCFTIAEIIATEDLGFFEPGCGVEAVREGRTLRTGAMPINTSGGLKAKGHPVGATGTAQVVELWRQMRGEAGARQVDRDVRFALAHNVGGSGCTCLVHIFERR